MAHDTTPAELDRVCTAAAGAAAGFAALPLAERAELLRTIAAKLRENGVAIIAAADAESHLGLPRLTGELERTCVQLELFAAAVEAGTFLEVIIDHADPAAKPAPRPDLRRMLVPLGPVAVFAASNFPLAFSVAGGDTASALAAGCPVVVKAHPGHPETSQLVAAILAEVLPDGVFALVEGFTAGQALVGHPAITAVGFTGSLAGGQALLDLVNARETPIPFYGELGALNPAIVTPAALADRRDEIVTGFVGSFTMGSGQFCTKPGLLFLPAGHGLDEALGAAAAAATTGQLLTENIQKGYEQGLTRFASAPGVRSLAGPAPALFAVAAGDLRGELLDECFGPAALVVEYQSPEELFATVRDLPGSLTATAHLGGSDELAPALLPLLAGIAGRVIVNGWPTGVAVTAAMQHGGPWPAATTSLYTSVGETAVRRFLRPVAFQNVPDALLPPALQESNPLDIPRRVS
ncbi:aldehyde dehydrogenase [Longispora fulva]|uniref:NADP-dependent aldehyde dehydrogenase n=1 Tax=Longispora fulva TaxID=619741 RepID=A0A8J7KNI5_9ACTN|nr:aldehyde dehydrogenase (NADP(+)) [Longispora fulva]MBG6140301.1 NADP-dependent aldehyde dehydrogenase [Longispora fulva]GIG57319.1 aldehyde dehydrogenase [Longispora fulva]